MRTWPLLCTALSLAGCGYKAPLQLIASTRPLDSGHVFTTYARVEGRACRSSLLFFPSALTDDNSLDTAKALALQNLPADGLMDVTVDVEFWTIPYIYAERCTVIRGTPFAITGFRSDPKAQPSSSGAATATPAKPAQKAPTAASTAAAPSDATVDRKIASSKRLLKMCRDRYEQELVTVKLTLTVNPTGQVGDVTLAQGNEQFADCARKALRSLSFSPFEGNPAAYERELDLSAE